MIVKVLEDVGVDGLVMINLFGLCMVIDIESGYLIMGSKIGYGWLFGVFIRFLVIRNIYDVV